jgi:hypothetical protein
MRWSVACIAIRLFATEVGIELGFIRFSSCSVRLVDPMYYFGSRLSYLMVWAQGSLG